MRQGRSPAMTHKKSFSAQGERGYFRSRTEKAEMKSFARVGEHTRALFPELQLFPKDSLYLL